MPVNREIMEQLLCGHDPTCGVVAVEPAGRFFRLFIRGRQGVTIHDRPFHPFILLTDSGAVSRSGVPCTLEPLTGSGQYRYRAWFDNWHDCCAMADYLQRSSGYPAGAVEAPYLFLGDSTRQFLLISGITGYKGLDPSQVCCLALKVAVESELAGGCCVESGDRPLMAIAVAAGNGREELLRRDRLGEPQMLERLSGLITELDPDIVLVENRSHNDIQKLVARARQLGIRLAWGRNGSEPALSKHGAQQAGRTAEQRDWCIYGRQVLAAASLERRHTCGADVVGSHEREMCFSELMTAARTILASFRQEAPARLMLAGMLFGNLPVRPPRPGLAAHELLLREYLRRGQALPARSSAVYARSVPRAEQVLQGVVGPVVRCDLTLLYPAIMQAYRLKPAGDELGLVSALASYLCARYREVSALHEPSQACRRVYRSLLRDLQGVLQPSAGLFGDAEVAAEVRRLGQVFQTDMLSWLKEHGAQPVVADGDALYFAPPAGLDGTEALNGLLSRFATVLPTGLHLEIDGRYQAMIAYKPGNYALRDQAGQVTVKGSSLLPHGHEPYLHDFVQEVLALLLEGRPAEVPWLYARYLRRLSEHRFPISWVARSEYLMESPERYQAEVASGQRHHSAAYELALTAGRSFAAGARICYYVVGSSADITVYNHVRLAEQYDPAHPDLNIAWYAEKLRQVQQRVTGFLPAQPSLFD